MKGLGITAIVLGVVSLGIAIYCQVEIVPNYERYSNIGDLQEFERAMWRTYSEQKFLFGSIALFLGPVAALMGLISALKKYTLGWVALGLGLVAFILGAMQSTHMFS